MRFTAIGLVACCLLSVPAVAQGMKGITDPQISDAVERALWRDRVVDANRLDVTTHDGIVTLDGIVSTILAEDRAVATTASVKGVRGIVNEVVVASSTKSDAELRSDVTRALQADPATDAYEVSATVDEGAVTLTGTVGSWQEKQLCGLVVKDVAGVRDVNNRIDVDYDVDRPRAEIEPEIVALLENDVRVDDHLIDVTVEEDGEVELSGTVGSLAEKRRAISDAWVNGVTSVDAGDLEVRVWARNKLRRQSSYVDRTDAETKRAISDAFVHDPRVLAYRPDVSVQDGVVTLRGIVSDLEAKRAAERTARNVIGVWRVKNHLKVRPDEIPSDEVLEQRVSTALGKAAHVERYEIDVGASRGWIYLAGDVHTSFEKKQAERVAQGVAGVTGVTNQLEFVHTWKWKPDREIHEDVREALFWNPFLDDDRIHVDVEDGVVTLRGEVQTGGESSLAERNALEAGAKDVRNRLAIEHPFYGPGYPTWDLYSPATPVEVTEAGTRREAAERQ